jgi:hypothetical protein
VGVTGWVPPEPTSQGSDRRLDDDAEADTLYRLLEEEVVPRYYRDASAFTEVRRYAIAYNGS